MSPAVGLRADFTGSDLRGLARSSRGGNQVRRLLALTTIYQGGTRGAAAVVGGVGLQSVRDRIIRFNRVGPAALVHGKALGQRPLIEAIHKIALAAAIEAGPIPAARGVVR